MRKVFPGILWCALLSANCGLILGACMKPVDVRFSSEGDRSETAVKVNVDVGFEEPADFLPVLEASIGGKIWRVSADGKEMVPVFLSSLGADAITVINMEDYDTVEWHYNGSPVEDGATLVLGSMTAIFNKVGVYPVTAIGKKGTALYSTLFYVKVES